MTPKQVAHRLAADLLASAVNLLDFPEDYLCCDPAVTPENAKEVEDEIFTILERLRKTAQRG